jgi:membrane AbrB-like protein
VTGELALLLLCGVVGAGVAQALRLPMWPLTGALVGTAAVHVAMSGSVQIPNAWKVGAQVLVGTAVGATVAPDLLRQFRAVLVPGAVAVVALIGVGVGCGLAMGAAGVLDPTVAAFGMVPGGVGEMVAAAQALQADSALVAGVHVVRLLIVLWSLPLLVRWVTRRFGDGAPAE